MISNNNLEIKKTFNLNNLRNDTYIKKKYNFNNIEYDIIRYNKSELKKIVDDDPEYYNTLSKCRSIVLRNNKVVVYSPEKSLTFDKYKSISTESISWMEDFIDGTMINVFFDDINNIWEICTRSTVGGNILFFNDIKNYNYFNLNQQDFEHYNNITFRSMFFEACNSCNFNLNTLDKKYSYTFVLQHPFNRIVTPITYPTIYLIKVYNINTDNNMNVTVIEKNINEFYNENKYIFNDTRVLFPNKYEIINDFNTILNFYNSFTIDYHIVGIVICDKNGNRTKIRNPNYEKVRKLRGNQPKLQYNYLSLRKENKLNEFLSHYPEHTILFRKFQTLLYNYTDELYRNYISCYIKKDKMLKDYDFQYKTHMYNLHQKYITELKHSNKHIDKKFVIEYINSLEPAQQMFVINYSTYKKDYYQKYNDNDNYIKENNIYNQNTTEIYNDDNDNDNNC